MPSLDDDRWPVGPGRTRIGWIGTGVMGGPMCGHLLAAGYEVTIWNRTRARATELEANGARWVDSAGAVSAASDVVFTMLGFPQDVREVTLGDGGVLEHAPAGAILVDMTTSDPGLAEEIATAAGTRGLGSLDAPVSGGDVGARNAALSIMVGGDGPSFAAVLPCLELMGATVVHQGGAGAGQRTKLTNQVLIAGNMVAVCEALLFAHRAGLDLESVLQSVSSGAAGSWALSNLAPRVLAGDLGPGFFVDHFVKDMGIALAEAERMRLSVPGLALAHQLYVALQAQGHGRAGTQALIRALASLSNLDWPPG